MSNVPELRFPEFNGEWVEKRLGEIAKFFKGKGISKNDIDANGIYKCIRYGELFTIYKETIREIFSKTNQYENMIISEGNETLMPTSDVTPNGLATASALNEKSVIIGGDILIIKSDKLINSFLSYYIKSHKKQIMRLVTGITVYHIYANDMKNFKIILPPTLAEQQKIASFLSAIDVKINLQEQKTNQLEKYKKALLQKLFPTKDTKMPELRFPEFSGEWVSVKVKDIFDEITRGKVLSTDKIYKIQSGLYKFPVYSSQTLNNGLLGYYKEYLFENAVTWTTDGANAGKVQYRQGKFYCTNVSGVLISKKGYANQCIAEILNKVTKKYVSYVGNPKLMNNAMAEISILIPPTLAEQQKIASFFSSIDEKIEFEKEKLKKIKEYKKGLLQKMFV